MADRRGRAVQKSATAGGENGDIAAAAGEDSDVEELGQTIERTVALILRIAGLAADSRIANDVCGQVGKAGDEAVDLLDRLGNRGVGVGAKRLDGIGGVAQGQSDVAGAADDFALLDKVVRRESQRADCAVEVGQSVA